MDYRTIKHTVPKCALGGIDVKKRLISILMIMVLLLCLFPITTPVAAPNNYLIENGVLIKYTGKETRIVIPEGVTTIGEGAFPWWENSKITSVTMPDSVTTIERRAIQSTSMTKLVLSKNLKSIGEDAFVGNKKLKTVNLPYGLERIDVGAFGGCTSLVNMTIPATVKYIGQYALDSLVKKQEFVILGDGILYKYNGKGGNVVIPNNVKAIGEFAFSYTPFATPLKSVTIPGSVKEIWNGAFWECSHLTMVKLPEGIKSISPNAFSGCSGLTKINIPKSLEDGSLLSYRSKVKLDNQSEDFDIRGNYILYKYNGADMDVVIPEGVRMIAGAAFAGNKTMKSVVIPDSVVSIGMSAFDSCAALEQIEIPDSVTSIEEGAFSNCRKLYSVKLPAGLTRIEPDTFSACYILQSINIPDKVSVIGEGAFKACYRLKDIQLPNGVTSIGKYAFSSTVVNNLIIPASVIHIGESAFGSNVTTELTILNGNARIDENAFYGSEDRKNVTITAPAGGSVQRMAARRKLKFKAYEN